jgi:Terpene cyclase DEP1
VDHDRDSDNRPRTWPNAASWLYLVAAAGGLIGTAIYNIQGALNPMGGPGTIASTLFGNPLSASLSIDLLVAASAASIFMILEGRRLGMRLPWLYVVGSFVTAIAFTFPLFLAMRERRLSANQPSD